MRALRRAATAWLDRRTQAPRRRHGEALFHGQRPKPIDGLASSLYYDLTVGLWRHRSASPGYLDAFLAGLDRCPVPARVIDLGTGVGASAAAVAGRHPRSRVVGVDASRRMMRVARRINRRSNLSFVRARYDRLPFADRSFDLGSMLNAVADPAELRRVLREGGRVLVASSFFATPPPAWFERWRELGFEPIGAGEVAGGHWELYELRAG